MTIRIEFKDGDSRRFDDVKNYYVADENNLFFKN